jgi:hypothetical protein
MLAEEVSPDGQEFDRLDEFGHSLAKTRAEAIAGRQNSGIEDDWLEDEEFYQGIDDANRGEFRNAWRTKPPGQITPKAETGTRSTVFPNITRPYCDMAAARIADMLMPTDDRMFDMEPTPVPDLVSMVNGDPPKSLIQEANTMFPDKPELAQQYIQESAKRAKGLMAEAVKKATLGRDRIDDWLEECRYQSENRRVIEDAARLGTGVLKGPVPEKKKITVYLNGELVNKTKINPASKRVDPWNCFPDPACGENIHNGSYFWERDFLTKRQLRDLRNMPGYIPEQIDKCLREGPHHATAEYKPTPETESEKKGRYEVWYFHGIAEREDLQAAGVELDEEQDEVFVPAMVVMVNNHVIKAALNPLDSGEFPYDVMVWQRRAGHWAGIGVARQIRTPQRMVTAGTRNLMDNAGLAAGPMLVFLQGVLSSDNTLGLGPRKIFYLAQDAELIDDARKAVGVIKIDMLVNELMEIINLGLRFAEDVTGMPMIMQGQLGKAPDTVGGMEMLFNAASSVLRRLARLYDDAITEPHIGRYYTWLLQYGDDEEKGDYCIKARGSSALVERSIQSQELAVVIQLSQNPTNGIDPRKAVDEFLKSRHFNPENFHFDDEKWEQIVTNLAQPQQQDTSLEVANLKAEVEREKIASNERMKQAGMDFEATQNEISRQYELAFKEIEEQLESGAQANDLQISLNEIRTNLARDVMKIKAQMRMADSKAKMPEIAKPAVEPAGRAPAGMSYQR